MRQSARGNLPSDPRAGVLRAPAQWVRDRLPRGGAWGTRARPSPPRSRAKRCESPLRRKYAVTAFRVCRVSGTARRRRPTRTVCGEVQLGELRRRLAVRGASARPSAAELCSPVSLSDETGSAAWRLALGENLIRQRPHSRARRDNSAQGRRMTNALHGSNALQDGQSQQSNRGKQRANMEPSS